MIRTTNREVLMVAGATMRRDRVGCELRYRGFTVSNPGYVVTDEQMHAELQRMILAQYEEDESESV